MRILVTRAEGVTRRRAHVRRPRRTVRAILCLATLAAAPAPAQACGPDTDCIVGERSYRIAVPEGEGPFGVILFLHGYRGRAADAMTYAALRDVARSLDVALLAPQGQDGNWNLPNQPGAPVPSAEPQLEALDAVIADAAARFPLDRSKMLATGFSSGAMAVWTLACRRPAEFSGFVPISGTFWAPLPTDCTAAPVDLIHVHGTADATVPLAGRAIGNAAQGDVRAALALFRSRGGYGDFAPAPSMAGLGCEAATEPSGHALMLCLHGGGHEMDPAWIAAAYRAFVR